MDEASVASCRPGTQAQPPQAPTGGRSAARTHAIQPKYYLATENIDTTRNQVLAQRDPALPLPVAPRPTFGIRQPWTARGSRAWWGAWYRTSWDSPWSDQTTSWPVDIRGRARTGRPRRQPQGPADAARDDPAGPRPQHRRRADLPGSLVGIAPDGTVHVSGDGGTIWSHRGSAGGAPEALTASGDQVYAAVDGKIVSSDDAGRTFRTRYQGS